MRKTLDAFFFGTVLLCLAVPGYACQERAAPAQGPQEKEAGATSKGVTPRASAARYAAHAELGGVTVGATMLTPDEVRQIFITDLNRCCVVFEIALYPEEGKTPEIARQDFTFRVEGTNIAAKSSSPKLLALTLQLTSRSEPDYTPHGSVGVTYGSGGYDPTTGQPRGRGVGTSAEVGVGAGGSDTQPTETDRQFMELELTKKSLPEGRIAAPVAGYLYFPLTKKNKKKAARQLEFTLAGQKVALTLP
jgi:hypothetical protein